MQKRAAQRATPESDSCESSVSAHQSAIPGLADGPGARLSAQEAQMGIKGPIPQREDETVRRNKPEVPVTKIGVSGPVVIPDLGIPNAHPMVKDLYESMKISGQARYLEPSDWQYARVTFHFLNKLLKTRKGPPSAMMLATVNQMMTSLLLTEGDRRRVRIEVERSQLGDDGEDAKVIPISQVYRDALAESAKK